MCLLQAQERLSKLYEKCLDGEYEICSKCDGTGYDSEIRGLPCNKCWGEGILDWIEKIMGKECPFAESGHSASSTSCSNSGVPVPPQSVKKYINSLKGKQYEHNNSIRSRAVQRFYKMSYKFKRCLQRRGH